MANSRLFPTLKLPSFMPIEQVNERKKCRKCGRKRMYFCYDCRIYVNDDAQKFAPDVKLPINVDIVKHQMELNGKSTAVHALLLAPQETRIFDKFSDVPEYSGEGAADTVVLCPSPKSISIRQFVANGRRPIRRIVVLDSTWNTLGSLKSIPQLAELPWVHLSEYRTEYWRPQNGLSSEHLATIEAIYFACKECVEAETLLRGRRQQKSEEEMAKNENGMKEEGGKDGKTIGIEKADEEEGGELDGLLFWFYFFRQKIPHSKFGEQTTPTKPNDENFVELNKISN